MMQRRVKQNFLIVLGAAVLGDALMSIAAAQSAEPASSLEEAPIARQHYSNTQYRFSFEYPSSWILTEDTPLDGALLAVRLLRPDENVPIMRERSPGSFALAVFANPQRLPIRTWLDSKGWPFGTERITREISVTGKAALDVSTTRMFAPNHFIYLAEGDQVFRMSPIAEGSLAVLMSFRTNP